ncbi:MAG: hypothetical protein U0441_16395 [Polyangiaceae bacterium]
MMRVSLLCLSLVTLAACDIPAAVFDGGNQTTTSFGGSSSTSQAGSGGDTTTTTPMHTTTSDSGGGGTGGTGGVTGGTGGTTTTSTTSVTGPTVTCNYPNVSECMPGQVCCFGPNMPTDDCGAPGSCNPPTDYIEIACDQDADCAGNATKKKCCAYFAGDISGNLVFQKTYCDTACDLASQETSACLTTADCSGILTCQEMLGSAYPDTLFCLSPI